MTEENKALVKSSIALARFDPKARNELVVRGLIALAEVRDADFYFFKGEEHRIKGELRQALDNYEKALRIDPKHVDSLFFMGYCYLRALRIDGKVDDKPQYKRAEEAFQALINIKEKESNISWYDYTIYHNLGVAQSMRGSYEEAIKSFGQAIELNQKHWVSYLGIANTQHSLGLYEEAIESCKRVIELNPEDANAYYTLGLCQEKIGLEHLVLDNFEKYISLDGDKSPGCVEYAKYRVKQLKGITNTSPGPHD